jgi:hypothetical protein
LAGARRCSLEASLAASEPRPGGGHLQQQLDALRTALSPSGRAGDWCRGALEAAGLVWVPRRGQVATRCVLARAPAVLLVHLRRAAWTAAGEAKLAGHVSFPAFLDLGSLPRLGGGAPPAPLRQAPEPGPCSAARWQYQRYQLRAVVVHHGPGPSSGHYDTYRQLDQAAGPPAGQMDPDGAGQAHRQLEPGAGHWARLSDEASSSAELAEVLSSEAAVLAYELMPPEPEAPSPLPDPAGPLGEAEPRGVAS